jgi:translation initiation factor 1
MAKKNRVNVVYSTNPDFDYQEHSDVIETLAFNKQKLYVLLDRKNRGGKSVTLVEGFIGNDDDAKDLAKKLKQYCGVGGGFKNEEIYIQGDQKSKVVSFLKKLGAEVKLKGG